MFEKGYDQINLNNALVEAVSSSNLEKVKELLSLEIPPFVDVEINGTPVILVAAQKGDWGIVEELYNMEADLDAKVPWLEWHLIHECIKTAPDRVTKAVLEYCNINAQTKDGKTPLMVAIKENKIDMANYLVDLGRMDLSLTDSKGNNAAHYAASSGEYDLFIKVAQAGVPLNKLNNEDRTPVDLIQDISFKENLPKILGELAKIEKKKKEIVEDNSVADNIEVAEDKKEEPKKKVTGLSSIKKK